MVRFPPWADIVFDIRSFTSALWSNWSLFFIWSLLEESVRSVKLTNKFLLILRLILTVVMHSPPSKLHTIAVATNAHKCTKISLYTQRFATCFGQQCCYLQGGEIQRVDTLNSVK